MFNWLTRNAISSVKAIRMRFSTKNRDPNLPAVIIPKIEDYDYFLDRIILHVDKSLIIKDLITRKNVIITRPRRWGKSLGLNMIRSFFQPKFSSEGDIINDDEKKAKFRKLNIGSADLNWNPITDTKEETKIIDLQGSLPVITLTFGDVGGFITEKDIIACFRNVLRVGIDDHHYLFESKNIKDKYYQELLKQHFSEPSYNVKENDIVYTLTAFIKSLNEHHNKKVILLVDEYDKTLVSVKLNSPDLYEYACTLYKNLFSILKDNSEIVQLSVFTGVTRIAKEQIFLDINNLYQDSVVSPEIDNEKVEHFGFTETEIEHLITQAKQMSKFKLDEDEIKEKLSWFYNGYSIQGKLIYNPWSIMNCLYALVNHKPAYSNYWLRTGSPVLLTNAVKEHKKLKQIQEKINEQKKNTNKIEDKNEYKVELKAENKIEMLIETGKVKFIPDDGIKFDKIHNNEDSLLTLMLDAGYITSADEKGVYRIPNNEIKHEFFKSIYDAWFSKEEMYLMKNAFNADEFEDPGIFIKLSQKRILDNVKNEHYPEFFFKTILYASVENTFGALKYRTKDNKKIEIVVKSPKDGKTVYIIEIKKKENDSNKTPIDEGLEQILEKRYKKSIINDYKEFKTIVLRIVYFELNQFSKWEISMVELKFTRDNLKNAIECFDLKIIPGKTSKEIESKEFESKEIGRKEFEVKKCCIITTFSKNCRSLLSVSFLEKIMKLIG